MAMAIAMENERSKLASRESLRRSSLTGAAHDPRPASRGGGSSYKGSSGSLPAEETARARPSLFVRKKMPFVRPCRLPPRAQAVWPYASLPFLAASFGFLGFPKPHLLACVAPLFRHARRWERVCVVDLWE